MTTMGRWFSRRWLFSLYGHAVNTSCCLSVPSLVRSLARSLALLGIRSLVRSLFSSYVRTLSFLVRSVQVGTRRGIQAVIRFVRARTPTFPIDRSNGTLPHPRFSIARHRVLLSRVYAITRLLHLLLHLILLTLVSLSPALNPSRPPHRALGLSNRCCVFFHTFPYPFILRSPPSKASNFFYFYHVKANSSFAELCPRSLLYQWHKHGTK